MGSLSLTQLRASLTSLATYLLLASAAHAATVLEKDVHVVIRDDDTLRQTTRLRVRIEDAADVARWSTYRVRVGDDRTLESLAIRATLPGGRTVTVGEDDRQVVEQSVGSSFYAPRHYHQARLSALVPGAVVTVDEAVTVSPPYRASQLRLRGGEPIDKLEVTVEDQRRTTGGHGWRWRLGGPGDGLSIEESERGVVVRGEDLPGVEPVQFEPAGGTVLRFGWGTDGTWDDVGRWYGQIVSSVPRGGPAISAAAEAVAGDLETPRQRLEALAGFVQQKVRFIAVLIGSGNYIPSTPAAVLERHWGDCKDKTLLLVEMLNAVGVEAYPALVTLGQYRRVDPLFPSHGQFTHAIAAIPDDEGYVFVDPTQHAGGGRWLHPQVQDQHALVVRPGGAELVRTPLAPELEVRRLTADLEVTAIGDARGQARLEIHGEIAYEMTARLADLAEERVEEEVRALYAHLMPGTELTGLTWSIDEGPVPGLELNATLAMRGLVQGGDGRRSFQLPGMLTTPDPQLLRQREIPVALPARAVYMTWNLDLPDGWCPPVPRDDAVDNAAGTFRHQVTADGGGVRIERRAEMRQRWIETEMVPALYELAQAEHRAHQRRTRLACGGR